MVYGVKSMFYKGKYRFFRKSVVSNPNFRRKSVFFSPCFYRKSVVLISVGITYLPIYYIMCIELKEISAWCFNCSSVNPVACMI